jgi:serine protease Do
MGDSSLQRLSLWLMAVSLGVVVAFYGLPELAHRVTRAVERGRADAAGVQLRQLGETSEAFRLVAKRVAPAVVNVNNLAVVSRPVLRLSPFGQRFFDEQQGLGRQGQGSGFVIDAQGHVVTNRHVVSGADRVQVRFSNGSEYPARLVGADPHTDLAVLKVEASGLVAAEFGDSEEIEVGDWVVAIGNPFGLEQSVTAGIVSAKGRSGVTEQLDVQDFLQTDAAINPGNSGGPLVDLQGHVVGVNTMIVSQSGGYQGIGFAIPSRIARTIAERLIKDGKVALGWIGVTGRGLADLAVNERRPEGSRARSGVLVQDVFPDSPAERAGLKADDIIVAVGSRPIETLLELRSLVATTKIGTSLDVELDRAGKPLKLAVAIEEQPAGLASLEERMGLAVADLTEELAELVGLNRSRGVVVTRVHRGSPADRAGVRPGDVIASVGKQDVSTVTQFLRSAQRIDMSKGLLVAIETPRGSRRLVVLEE